MTTDTEGEILYQVTDMMTQSSRYTCFTILSVFFIVIRNLPVTRWQLKGKHSKEGK